jgi:SAM-dependent methyltransferase
MKLSELVDFRNQLNELSSAEPKVLAQSKLDIIMHAIEYPHSESVKPLADPFTPELHSNLKEVYQAFDKFSANIDQLKKQVQAQITEQEKQWFQESYRLFELAQDCETTDQILYGRTPTGEKSDLTIEAEETLRARLSSYADWRWPGIIIRPGVENYVENMVGCDPLYLIDRTHDLLSPCLNRFPLLYQNRLRSYTTNDWSDQPILSRIPDDQFGVCLAHNVFNHRPLEIIRKYLEEIYTKLRAGGALLMSYNDCDRTHAVMLVEQFAASYTPGYLIQDLVKDVGFDIISSWSDGGPSVWLELRKPGELTSRRGGQVISVIHSIESCYGDVDFLKRKVYTTTEVENLQEEAKDLNIEQDIIDRLCSTYPFELQLLITEIKDRLYQEAREKEKLDNLVILAKKYNIDLTSPGWQDAVESASNQEAERQRVIAFKREKKRIKELHQLAKSYNINPQLYNQEEEIHRLIAEAIDQKKKDELKLLRQRAMELQAGDPNLIKYGYSAEKLKQLIKEKEEKQ